MNVSVRPEDRRFIEEQIRAGRFASAEDVVATALERLRGEGGGDFGDVEEGEPDAQAANPARGAAAPPGPVQRVRVTGRLWRVLDGGNSFSLLLDTDRTITVSWVGVGPPPAAPLLGQRVTVEGRAFFSADGSLVRLEADYAGPAAAGDALFSQMPAPWGHSLDEAALDVPQTPTTGLNAAWGMWPGDESEEEILRALEEADR